MKKELLEYWREVATELLKIDIEKLYLFVKREPQGDIEEITHKVAAQILHLKEQYPKLSDDEIVEKYLFHIKNIYTKYNIKT